jgi:hypothetical protein
MIEEHDDASYTGSYIEDNNRKYSQELEYQINEGIKTQDELIEFYEEGIMGENDLYYIYISNNIALNLLQSLTKLKKGQSYQKLFDNPCQIKIFRKSKLMVIYLVVYHNFLRIKVELQYLRKNKLKDNSISKHKEGASLEISQSPNIVLKNDNKENDNEIIFTIELKDFFNLLDLVLCGNKDYPIILGLDKGFSTLTGKSVCIDVYNQMLNSPEFKYNLLKNDVFYYAISSPIKIKNKKNDSFKYNDNDNLSEKDYSRGDIHINKEVKNEDKSNNNKCEDEQNEILEKIFSIELRSAKYMIEGRDLMDLYSFMRGLDILYDGLATHNIGISMTNDKALFFCLAMENINSARYLDSISKNITQQLRLNIKSLMNHSFTDFTYGFNSFYRTKYLSRFITSFYNKNDKRLLVKVSNAGKMILSYTFSDPKNDLIYEQNQNKNNGNSEEKIGEDDEHNNDSESTSKKKMYKDRLLDDENRGNIVEMIFYPLVFDICKNFN